MTKKNQAHNSTTTPRSILGHYSEDQNIFYSQRLDDLYGIFWSFYFRNVSAVVVPSIELNYACKGYAVTKGLKVQLSEKNHVFYLFLRDVRLDWIEKITAANTNKLRSDLRMGSPAWKSWARMGLHIEPGAGLYFGPNGRARLGLKENRILAMVRPGSGLVGLWSGQAQAWFLRAGLGPAFPGSGLLGPAQLLARYPHRSRIGGCPVLTYFLKFYQFAHKSFRYFSEKNTINQKY